MTNFGSLLRTWRTTRRFSQLGLSLAAGASARHISFLESGRAGPSREMVLRLAETLEMPHATTNNALLAAGFAPVYPTLTADDKRMSAANKAVDLLLSNHEPLPAIVFDNRWTLLRMNTGAERMFGQLGFAVGDNLVSGFVGLEIQNGPLHNWLEVAVLISARLRTEIAHAGSDAHLSSLLEQLCKRREEVSGNPNDDSAFAGTSTAETVPLIPLRLRAGEQMLSMFSMIVQFASVQEITLADLRIELYFPENEATRSFIVELSQNQATIDALGK